MGKLKRLYEFRLDLVTNEKSLAVATMRSTLMVTMMQ